MVAVLLPESSIDLIFILVGENSKTTASLRLDTLPPVDKPILVLKRQIL